MMMMMMISIQEIRKLVLSYLSGEISASEFANSYTPLFGSSLKSNDDSVRKLSLAVHAQISHFFNGLISEGDLRLKLRTLAEPINYVVGAPVMNVSVNHYQVVEMAFLRNQPSDV